MKEAIEQTVEWLRECVARGYVPSEAEVRRYARSRWPKLDAFRIEAATQKADW